MSNHNLPLILICWAAVIFLMAVVRRHKGTAGVGLVLAYILNFTMQFGAAGVLYLLPWYHGSFEELTTVGIEMSFWGFLGFAFGSLALSPALLDSGLLPRARGVHRAD